MFWLTGVQVNRKVSCLIPKTQVTIAVQILHNSSSSCAAGLTVVPSSSLRGGQVTFGRVPLAWPVLHIGPYPCGSKLRNPERFSDNP